VKIDKPLGFSNPMVHGEIGTLTATVNPWGASQGVKWISSAPHRVSVHDGGEDTDNDGIIDPSFPGARKPVKGYITAELPGRATIKVVSLDNSTIFDSINITVEEPAVPGNNVTGLNFNPDTMTLFLNGTTPSKTVAVNVTPEDAQDKNLITWSSGNDTIATVKEVTGFGGATAVVTAKSEGTTTVTATYNGSTTYSASLTVTVKTSDLTDVVIRPSDNYTAHKGQSNNISVEPQPWVDNIILKWEVTEGSDKIKLIPGNNPPGWIHSLDANIKPEDTSNAGDTAKIKVTICFGSDDNGNGVFDPGEIDDEWGSREIQVTIAE
jgi:hypothetical protein